MSDNEIRGSGLDLVLVQSMRWYSQMTTTTVCHFLFRYLYLLLAIFTIGAAVRLLDSGQFTDVRYNHTARLFLGRK